MNATTWTRGRTGRVAKIAIGVAALAAAGSLAGNLRGKSASPGAEERPPIWGRQSFRLERRQVIDTSGFSRLTGLVKAWPRDASLADIAKCWDHAGRRVAREIDDDEAAGRIPESQRIPVLLTKATMLLSEGEPAAAYQVALKARALAEADSLSSVRHLSTVIYVQGVASLRRGETENCIMCRGESSCILPISPAARHTKPDGSRMAIRHFTEYLGRFPEDLEIRWLLNLAHMTLGEYPERVDPRYLVPLDRFTHSEFDIGRFRDVGERAGVNRFNQAGGAAMEDFDNDGLLDLAVTAIDPTQAMTFYRNKGDGTFEDRTESAGVADQLGGLYCVQADYNNDGHMDLYIPRGAWLKVPMRPTLLRNKGDGSFADVTKEAGLLDPVNSNSASWADYDNDGWVDLFVCCEAQPNRLSHNKGDGTFEQVAAEAGVDGADRTSCKGSAWLDYDNDGDPDLFLNYLNGLAGFFRNDGKGVFTEVSLDLGIDGPSSGFSCWAWDYDNDGRLDLWATCYDRTVADVVKGLMGQPHGRASNRLFRNEKGGRFVDVTKEAGLDMVFSTMGSNFADFDNDGFLDMYLATGDPNLGTLVPSRMFKNVAGRRFAEITASSGTGHLQKGHAVACGDWDRDGDVDLFSDLGGAVNGDKYHNVLFENPGQGRHSLTVKLVGMKTNRAALGARIKVVSAGDAPATVHRHISSGSSFGANTLQQTIGLADATRVATLEVQWPTSGTTQVFHDIAADQAIEITEFAQEYRKLDWTPIRPPSE